MKIQQSELFGGKPYAVDFTVHQKDIVDDNQELSGTIGEDGLQVTGLVTRLSAKELQVDLDVAGEMVFPCARCLKPTAVSCDYEYHESAAVSPDDADFDLIPCVEECLFINEPFRVLCKPDCKGLCPHCGCDLNVTQCDCEEKFKQSEDAIDPRMAKLKALLPDEGAEK